MKARLTLGLLVLGFIAKGQSIDLFTLSYKNGFTQPVETGAGKASEQVILANLKAPLVITDSLIWYNDLTYQHFMVDYSAGGVDPTRLHAVMFQTGIVKKLSETTGFQLLLVPRLMSDFRNVDAGHFQLGGLGLFEKRYSKTFLARYGLMYNRDLFGHMFVPLVFLDWKVSEKWSVNGMLPITCKVNYQAGEKLGVGFSLFGLITSYQLGESLMNEDYIERKSVDISLYSRYRLGGNVHLEGRFGYALGRSYRQFAKGDKMDARVTAVGFGDDRIQKNTDFDAGPFVDVRLVYNLSLE